jgi:hypothetical protein
MERGMKHTEGVFERLNKEANFVMDLLPCSGGSHQFSARQGFNCSGCGFEYHYDNGVRGTPV